MSEKKNSSAKSALDNNNLENVSGGTVSYVAPVAGKYTVGKDISYYKKYIGAWQGGRELDPHHPKEYISGSFESEENAKKADSALDKLNGMKL